MENVNLIRKIALSFSLTSGLDFDDLFQEASLAYLEAMRTYDPKRGKITTHLWHCIQNRLISYLREEEKEKVFSIDDVDVNTIENSHPYFENLTMNAIKIADVILNSPNEFVCLTKDDAIKKVKKLMWYEGWDLRKIRIGLSDLKVAFS
jgi:RNA polymerase sigma factor (sigma-70 family)